MTRNPMNGWQWRCLYLAVNVIEGIVVAHIAKRSVVFVVVVCLALGVFRLAVEALQP